MAKINVPSCPSCGGSHQAKLYASRPLFRFGGRSKAISDGYFVCPTTWEAVHHFEDAGRREAYGRFCELIRSRRWLMTTTIADVGDDTNEVHETQHWRMTREFPKGDIKGFREFAEENIFSIAAEPVMQKLADATLSIHDPLDHLKEETDAEHPTAPVATVPGDASPDEAGPEPTAGV